MKIVCVIPARYESARFRAKPLALICGKPLIFHVYNQAKQAKLLDDVIVATDDARIKECVDGFKGKVLITSYRHRSSINRIIEILPQINADIIVNIYGDLLLADPSVIDSLIKLMLENPSVEIATLVKKVEDKKDLYDPNISKVIIDKDNFAMFFSRTPIPYKFKNNVEYEYLKHIGVYAYRRDFFLRIKELDNIPLEDIESLEQLRFLYYGYKIKTLLTNCKSINVEIPEDLKIAEKFLANT